MIYKILLAVLLFLPTSIYTFYFNDASGSPVQLSKFRGKKILIVNVATGSKRVGQLSELQTLQNRFSDSLVIIAFPSNSFGHEQKADSDIKQFCIDNYNTTYLIAGKISVKGSDIHPIFNWLTSQSENGAMTGEIVGDFQKYLIDESGNLQASFSPIVSPLSQMVIDAIETNYQ